MSRRYSMTWAATMAAVQAGVPVLFQTTEISQEEIMGRVKAALVTKRADIKGPADYCYTMRIARRRFKVDRHLQQGQTFRVWARKTYNPVAAAGKLKEIIAS